MPYLTKDMRQRLDEGDLPINGGDLNYLITRACLRYLKATDKPRYADYNTIIGALESAKLEFYRRAVAVYEGVKIKENGDVY